MGAIAYLRGQAAALLASAGALFAPASPAATGGEIPTGSTAVGMLAGREQVLNRRYEPAPQMFNRAQRRQLQRRFGAKRPKIASLVQGTVW